MAHTPCVRVATIRFSPWSASAKTRSNLVWSPALPGRAATRPALIFSSKSLCPNAWGCCTNWYPRPLGLPCWSIRPMLRRRDDVTSRAGSYTRHRIANNRNATGHAADPCGTAIVGFGPASRSAIERRSAAPGNARNQPSLPATDLKWCGREKWDSRTLQALTRPHLFFRAFEA
jgi:hypothetical protein